MDRGGSGWSPLTLTRLPDSDIWLLAPVTVNNRHLWIGKINDPFTSSEVCCLITNVTNWRDQRCSVTVGGVTVRPRDIYYLLVSSNFISHLYMFFFFNCFATVGSRWDLSELVLTRIFPELFFSRSRHVLLELHYNCSAEVFSDWMAATPDLSAERSFIRIVIGYLLAWQYQQSSRVTVYNNVCK